jgi:multiple sugar transport system permease protein
MKVSNKFMVYAILAVLLILCIFPFYIMIINSTHTTEELMVGLYLAPGNALFSNYGNLSQMTDIWKGFLNSTVISVSSTLLSAYFGALTAFGLAKYEYKGRK